MSKATSSVGRNGQVGVLERVFQTNAISTPKLADFLFIYLGLA